MARLLLPTHPLSGRATKKNPGIFLGFPNVPGVELGFLGHAALRLGTELRQLLRQCPDVRKHLANLALQTIRSIKYIRIPSDFLPRSIYLSVELGYCHQSGLVSIPSRRYILQDFSLRHSTILALFLHLK